MKLFFETSQQIAVFLIMAPIGFVIGICIDLASMGGRCKPVWDVLVMLLAIGCMGISIVILGQELRIYHFLSLLTGALLYMCGVRTAFQWALRRAKKKACTPGRNQAERVE